MNFTITIQVDENSTWPNGNRTLLNDLKFYKEKGFNDLVTSAVWQAVYAGHCVKVVDVKECIGENIPT